ncbi:T9SS type A sorting domain-containing protein [Epilithonimonas hungarica]|uniref:Por secretion system C-terminal sorting domain-containing protein n=1 Tax=Epilithonimonas hungarica TaxID=454006 RepID=A0A1G7PYC9_9FLAO|nr:T9SS type A sorting domain-containing protein [Epilithonimonas hungarica]SDF91302.1 Por secretion system C-terminal sorting domain-containing protein [Epilithonimonas hungarica]
MKKITFFAGLLFALFTNKTNAQIQVLGKNEFGRIFEVTYSITEQNTVYATTITNHILVSHDNGTSWEVFYSLPTEYGNITKLNISKDGSFLSFSTLKDGIGELHIFDIPSKTITKTFSMPNYSEGAFVSAYNFFENDKNTLIVSSQFPYGLGTANRVFTTTDGGENWKEVYYSVDDNHNIITSYVAFSPTDKSKIYIANGNGSEGVYGGLMISNNGGDTFTTKLEGSVLSTLEFNPNNPNEIFAGTGISFGMSPEKLHHTTDGGNTWEDKNITWGSNGILNNIIDIKFNPLDNNHVIVLEEDEIVSTKDGGTTWQSVEYPYDNLDSYYYGIKASFNPFKAGELFITANYKPLFSTDNGATLAQVQTPFYSSTGRVNLFENSTAKHLFYSVQSGFVHRNLADNSENAFNIEPLNIFSTNNTPSYISDSKTEGRIYTFKGGFMGSTLSMSNDFGATSNTIFETFTSGLTNVIPDPQVNNQIYTTFDNWGQGELDKINFNDQNNIITTNIPLPAQASVYKILHPNNISDEFFILIGSEVYKTTNGGTDWAPVSLGSDFPSDAAVFDIVQNPKNTDQLALGTSSGVYVSNDKGVTWALTGEFVANKVAYSDINSGVLIATTYTSQFTQFNVYYSVDNGANWESVDRKDLLYSETSSVTIDFSDKNAYIYIASADLGLLGYSLNLDILATGEVSGEKSKVLVYPNPVVDIVHIDNKNLKSVALYNMEGKKLLETKSNEMNVSKLPNGVYVLRIVTSDNSIVSKKIIKK